MTPQLQCECGNQLRVSEHHAGRQVQCPVCGKAIVVTASVSVQQAGPRRWPLPALVALLVLAAGAAAGWWLLFHGTSPHKEGDDMLVVPANAQGFVCVRLADLWKTPAMQEALQATDDDPAGQMEVETGLRPEQVERLWGVMVDRDGQINWLVACTIGPYDKNKVLSRLGEQRESEYQGEHYHVGTGADERTWAVLFVSARVLVMANERCMKHCIDFRKGGWAPGPLGTQIGLAEMTRHTAMAGFNPAGGPGKSKAFNDLAEIRLAAATLDVSDTVVLAGRVETPGEETAKKMQTAIEQRRMLAQLALAVAQLSGGDQGKTAKSLSELLKQIKFEQKGAELRLTANVDDGSRFAGIFLGLPRLLTRK